MRITTKKCLSLVLVSGLVLLAFFHGWSSRNYSAVDIRIKHRGSLATQVNQRKLHVVANGYPDIAYSIKEEVARYVIYYIHWS